MSATRDSTSLIEELRSAIRSRPNEVISFREFMQTCLYHPAYGYYMKDAVKIGKAGDYYTSSHIGSVMGEMIAKYAAGLIRTGIFTLPIRVMEWGAGSGRMARCLLDEWSRSAEEIYASAEYVLVDASPYHREQWDDLLAAHQSVIRYADPERAMIDGDSRPALVLCNELLDAFPVHRVGLRRNQLVELCVGWNERTASLVEVPVPLDNERVLEYIAKECPELADGQTIEVPIDAMDWWARLLDRLPTGSRILAIDYGDQAAELYGNHRMNGTFMCYRSHQANDHPYEHVGEQDMTAHVNFTAFMRNSRDRGWDVVSYMTQKEFLLECGVLDELREHNLADPFDPVVRRNRAIGQLLLGDAMSELFKVLIIHKK